MKRILPILLLFSQYANAQLPAYYQGIDYSQNGDSLKVELHNLVTNTHTTQLDYTSSINTDTWDALKQSDLKDGSTTDVLLVYGYDDLDAITQNDRTRSKDSSCHTSGCNGLWNREHVYPQSLSIPPMTTQFPGTGTDIHNLRAADGQENSARGNDKYASGSGNSGSLTSSTYYAGDEWKGDVARIIMYMYLRYDTECPAINVGAGSTAHSNNGDMPDIFLEWNAQDPPSQYEKNRNNIFQTLQGNRNPFIDNPYLATKIWNGPTALNTWGNVSTNDLSLKDTRIYPSITQGILYIRNYQSNSINYSIYDIYGSLIQKETYNNHIDISHFNRGMYFIRVSGNKSPIQKIVLQ